MKPIAILCVSCILVACANERSQDVGTCNDPNLDPSHLVESLAEEKSFPGIAVAVGVSDDIAWIYGHGYADIATAAPIDPEETKFRIGSTSKALTGLALAKIEQQEPFFLDQPVNKILTDLPVSYDGVTIRQLSGHLGGVRHYNDFSELGNTTEYLSSNSALDIFVNDPLVASPGTTFTYSTYGFTIISAALEARYQKHFLEIMSEIVFDPLGMDNTVPDRTEIAPPDRTQFYYLDENEELIIGDEINSSNKWAGGGFLASAVDLTRFGLAHFDDTILTEESRELLWTSQLDISGVEIGYGVGWFIDDDWVQHPGGALGGSTLLRIYPEEEIVIVMMANLSALGGDTFDNLPDLLFECFSKNQ